MFCKKTGIMIPKIAVVIVNVAVSALGYILLEIPRDQGSVHTVQAHIRKHKNANEKSKIVS